MLYSTVEGSGEASPVQELSQAREEQAVQHCWILWTILASDK